MPTVWDTPGPRAWNALTPRVRQHVQFTADLIANPLKWAIYPGKPKGASGFAKSRSKDVRKIGRFVATTRGTGTNAKAWVRFVPTGADESE